MSVNNDHRISSDSAQREPLLPKKEEAPTPVSRMQLLFTRNVYVGNRRKSVASIVKETGLSKREVLQLHNEHKLAALYQQTYPLFEGEVHLT